jgi:glucan 1,3-beta-glucosidase
MLWQTGDTVKQTLDALRILTKRYAPQTDVVTGIELLNEPNSHQGVQTEPLKQFYYDGNPSVSLQPQCGVPEQSTDPV